MANQSERELIALDQLLAGTPYADYHRVSTRGPDGHGVADVHNLVTLSRLPLLATREVRHSLVPPLQHSVQTAEPADTDYNCALIDPYSSRILMLATDGASLSLICTFVRPWRPPSPVRSSRREPKVTSWPPFGARHRPSNCAFS